MVYSLESKNHVKVVTRYVWKSFSMKSKKENFERKEDNLWNIIF